MDRQQAFTVLPPLSPRLPPPPRTPTPSRVAPLTVANHRERNAFIVLGEVGLETRSGRASPFRGRGFREPSPGSRIPVATGKSAPASPVKSKRGPATGTSAPASPRKDPGRAKRTSLGPNRGAARRTESPSKLPRRPPPGPAKEQQSGKRVSTRPIAARQPPQPRNAARPPLPAGRNESPSRPTPAARSRPGGPRSRNPTDSGVRDSGRRGETVRGRDRGGNRVGTSRGRVERGADPASRRPDPENVLELPFEDEIIVLEREEETEEGTEVESDASRAYEEMVAEKNRANQEYFDDKDEGKNTIMFAEEDEVENESGTFGDSDIADNVREEVTRVTSKVNKEEQMTYEKVEVMEASKTKEPEKNKEDKKALNPADRGHDVNENDKEKDVNKNIIITDLSTKIETKTGNAIDKAQKESANSVVKDGIPKQTGGTENGGKEKTATDKSKTTVIVTGKPEENKENVKILNGSIEAKAVIKRNGVDGEKLSILSSEDSKKGEIVVRSTMSPAIELAQPDIIPSGEGTEGDMDNAGDIKVPPDNEVEAGNSHTVTFSSPELRPTSVSKRGNVWGRLRNGILLTSCWKPKSNKVGRTKAAPIMVQPQVPQATPKEKKTFLAKLRNWTRRKGKKGKSKVSKNKRRCHNLWARLNCCKRKKKPTTEVETSEPGKKWWRKLFCLDLACCTKCKRANKPKKSKEKKPSFAGFPKLEPTLVEHTSIMKGAIPVLPSCLAWMCLFINIFLPGIGTLMSGLLCLCFGKPRFSVNDTAPARLGSFCVNFIVAVSQLFTIIFCLVGWGWSIWWGVIMVKLARKNRRIKLAEKNAEHHPAPVAVNQNHDVERAVAR